MDSRVCQIWNFSDKTPTLAHEFECNHGAVLAIVARGDTIFAGCQDGYVRVFDLETKTLVRTIIVQEVGMWPLTIGAFAERKSGRRHHRYVTFEV